MALPGLTTVLAGLVTVHLAMAALVLRWRWQRRQRPPVVEKWLRGPGERLRRRLDRIDEALPWLLIGSLLLPLVILTGGLGFLSRLDGSTAALGLLIATFGLFVLTATAGGWALFRVFNQRSALRRTLQGERTVAECLAPLIPAGYRVFYDVPTESGNPDDNLHHVVVGPAGIFCIESRTHTRRAALPGRKDHEIIYDGDQLVYPWGQDTQGLVPARTKAEWLSHWVFQVLGDRVPVAAVLTFPGWWVTAVVQRDVRVLNPGQLCALILDSTEEKLTHLQLQLLIRQLDARCRDVEM